MSDEALACLVVIVGGGLLIAMIAALVAVGSWVIDRDEQRTPQAVRRRAVELQRQDAEQQIAEIGQQTRAAIRAAAERRRRDNSV